MISCKYYHVLLAGWFSHLASTASSTTPYPCRLISLAKILHIVDSYFIVKRVKLREKDKKEGEFEDHNKSKLHCT
jgi:hypothetical protein